VNRELQEANTALVGAARMAHAGQEASAEVVRLRARVRDLEAVNGGLEAQVHVLATKVARLQAEVGEWKNKAASAALNGLFGGNSSPTLALDLPEGVTVMDVVKLCHPDRWAKTPMADKANEVTKWLLAKRE
jgi:hypothetical protein